jgi:hypothetical protein
MPALHNTKCLRALLADKPPAPPPMVQEQRLPDTRAKEVSHAEERDRHVAAT